VPNTLAHLGVQTLVTRGLMRDADVLWIWTGCVLPDLPWIAQRVARALLPGIPPIDLRLHAAVQSSLLFCLVLSASLACFSRRPGRAFAVLAGGSLLHLLLDALQTKWANGVVLLAPLRWDLTNLGLFWPEDPPTLALTALGLVVAPLAFWRLRPSGGDLRLPRGAALWAALALGALWAVGPAALAPRAERADLHYAATLRDMEGRAGRTIGFDRARLVAGGDGPRLRVWTGESLALAQAVPDLLPEPGAGPEAVPVSLRGRFLDAGTVEVAELRRHVPGLRDYASYLGLALVALWWALALGDAARAAYRDGWLRR
jgi:hypothetical protein